MRAILQNEALFGDDFPAWENALYADECEERLRDVINSLGRRGDRKDHPRCVLLAEVLAKCREGDRCGNGACDMCRHACHLHIVDETKRRYRVARSRGYRLVRIDVVLEEWQYGIGQLDAFDADAFGHEMQRLLQRSRILEARGALDVSLNRTVDGERYWQVHAHLACVLVPGDSLRAIKQRLARAVRSRDDAIDVPIMVQKCDGTAYSLSYLEKERFTVKNTAHDGTIYKHAIRRGTDYSELMLFLAGLGLTGHQIRYRGGYLHFDDQVFHEGARLQREREQERAFFPANPVGTPSGTASRRCLAR